MFFHAEIFNNVSFHRSGDSSVHLKLSKNDYSPEKPHQVAQRINEGNLVELHFITFAYSVHHFSKIMHRIAKFQGNFSFLPYERTVYVNVEEIL